MRVVNSADILHTIINSFFPHSHLFQKNVNVTVSFGSINWKQQD